MAAEHPAATTESRLVDRLRDVNEQNVLIVRRRAADEIERLWAALQEIADTDYRGNRSTESERAWRALNGR